jgi:serine/threonine protein kinase/Flp pilus assembly protein TadD
MEEIGASTTDFREGPAPDRHHPAVRSLIAEMGRRWQAGERPLVEEFLARHPWLSDTPDAALELIYEELTLRQRYGAPAEPAALLERFPLWRDALAVLQDCHQLLEGDPGPRFPVCGEALGDFVVIEELGRGGRGRVFLARQPALADRPVVLKLTPRGGGEHLSLARLQHTHVMPLYAMQEEPGRGLCILCMPYLGRVTLAALLEALPARPGTPRTGRQILDVLDATQDSYLPGPTRSPVRPLLARATFVQAICWLGACLADALNYAHERGLLHLDVKPSNVLLAGDGQPLLLDFHLARPPLRGGEVSPPWLGGTPGYMAPEHRAALEAVQAGAAVPGPVDGRADLYALGVLLYEALGGQGPYLPGHSPPLSAADTGVGVGLSDVVARCLATDPRQRYPDGAALAADLRRILDERPLLGVPNRSLREGWRRLRRRPSPALAFGLAALLLLAAFVAGSEGRHRHGEARRLLEAGQVHTREGRYESAVNALEHGLALAETVPGGGALAEDLRGALGQARRQWAVQELHLLADRVRYLYPFDTLPGPALRELEASCRKAWANRGPIRERLAVGPAAEDVQADLLDLALLGAELRARCAQADDRTSSQEGKQVLAEAEAEFGPSAALARARCRAGAPAGEVAAESPEPRTAWEHYALGRMLLSEGDLGQAARHLDEAMRLQPDGLWPHFYAGQCAYRRGSHDEAAAFFSVCIGATPHLAAAHFNRGLAYAALGRTERARDDYTWALALEPGLGVAALNRAILHLEAGRHDEAEADLQRALEGGADPATVHYNRAVLQQTRGNRAAVLESVREALRHNPAHAQALALWRSLEGARPTAAPDR